MENGFQIWSFNGKHLYKVSKDHFYQVNVQSLSFWMPFNDIQLSYVAMYLLHGLNGTVHMAPETTLTTDPREGRRDLKEPEEVQQEVRTRGPGRVQPVERAGQEEADTASGRMGLMGCQVEADA